MSQQIIEKLRNVWGQNGSPSQAVEEVRRVPYGVELITANSKEAEFRVQAAIYYWSWALPGFLFLFTVLVSPLIGLFVVSGWFRPEYLNMWNDVVVQRSIYAGLGLSVGLSSAATIASYFITRPKLAVKVSPDKIQVGRQTFDRRHYGGMRVGSTIQADITLKDSPFDHKNTTVSRLRIGYGQWGEDLIYVINSYHAAEIVVWMNDIIDNVGERKNVSPDPFQGQKIELL